MSHEGHPPAEQRGDEGASIDEGPVHERALEEIVVPIDGSQIERGVIEAMGPILRCCSPTVHGLYVRHDPEFGVQKRDRLRFDPDAEVETILGQFEREMDRARLDATTAVRSGTPHEEILRYAAEHDADLIVMGTHGRTGINRFTSGSVTETVIRRSPIPVLTLKDGD